MADFFELQCERRGHGDARGEGSGLEDGVEFLENRVLADTFGETILQTVDQRDDELLEVILGLQMFQQFFAVRRIGNHLTKLFEVESPIHIENKMFQKVFS
ncbi:MAG: hypothetical protein CVU65_13120 [Deltaproteobacteria bacterium HGW-Deltaproteobacteria-22]|nr:MAG: hypothetical protein CVU65_13120 [Deltaproteobacteria bacterium HGW-Deltaproteobacteria-22]